MKLTSSKNSTIILLILLIAALLFAIYYYFVLPKEEEAENLEISVGSIKSEISTLDSQITEIQEGKSKDTENLYALRKKIPETRNIDEVILNIEEIEYSTGVRIDGIEFNNYDENAKESNIIENNNENSEEGNANTENASSEAENTTSNSENASNEKQESTSENTQPVSEIASQVPADLKLITLNVKIQAPKLANVKKFIQEIENLERIMHIDSIEYDIPGEEQQFEETPQAVAATIQITTFYYTGNE